MEQFSLVPWILLTFISSFFPAFYAFRFAPWWQRHGDIGEAIGTSVVALTALFTVGMPILATDISLTEGLGVLAIGMILAVGAHHFFEKDGDVLAPKVWFVAITFALHNFPEGLASGRALLFANGGNIFTWSLLAHNVVDAMVMALGLMAMKLSRRHLILALLFAAGGEVGGMLLAGSALQQVEWISLVSVGALVGLAVDAAAHWFKGRFSAAQ